MVLSFGAILDPRYKLNIIEFYLSELGMEGPLLIEKLESVEDGLHNLYSAYEIQLNVVQDSTKGPSLNVGEERLCDDTEDDLAGFETFQSQYKQPIQKSQLDQYLDEPKLDKNQKSDILQLWKENQVRYPELALMAQDILSISITTVASESTFSIGGRIISKYRSSLCSTSAEALLCTRDWLFGLKDEDEINEQELILDIEKLIQPSIQPLTQDDLKKLAADKAVAYVSLGMVLGLGTGSTSAFVVDKIGQLLASGQLTNIIGVPTSKRTQEQAASLCIPLSILHDHPKLDLAIDGGSGLAMPVEVVQNVTYIGDHWWWWQQQLLRDESIMSTQEYIRKVIEDVGDDDNFTRVSWLSVVEYVNVDGGIMTGCFGDVNKFLKNWKLKKVVAIIKSCTPNVLSNLTVTLKDLYGTISGTISAYGGEVCKGDYRRSVFDTS
nr:zinc finger BED domain-containing protein RICESLEEPER 2-like [Tanacetum cinerariifolium]